MRDFDIISLIDDGLSELSHLVSEPYFAFPIGVLFTAFVALRAFYIQKRHERMADKYEEAFDILSKLSPFEPGTGIERKKDDDVPLKLVLLTRTTAIYFSPEAKAIIAKMREELIDLAKIRLRSNGTAGAG